MNGDLARRKSLVGTVVSGKMQKTVMVSVERLVEHPVYGKYMKRRVKYTVHDEKGDCKAGDKVLIVEGRPLSKLKRWRVKEIVERAR